MTIRINLNELEAKLGPFVLDKNAIKLAVAKELAKGLEDRIPVDTGELKKSIRAKPKGVTLVGKHKDSGIPNVTLAKIRGGKGIFQVRRKEFLRAEKAANLEICRQIQNGKLRF